MFGGVNAPYVWLKTPGGQTATTSRSQYASGTFADDHPHADIRVGEKFLADVYTAITTSPGWANTLLVINFDEWGGFFDHVAPGTAPDVSPTTALRGFRVPALVDLAPGPPPLRGTVDLRPHLGPQGDRVALGPPPLTPRDAHARNIAEVLDFATPPNLSAPPISCRPSSPLRCPARCPSTSRRERVDRPRGARRSTTDGASREPHPQSPRCSPGRRRRARRSSLSLGAAPADGGASGALDRGLRLRPADRARLRDQHREQGLRRDLGRRLGRAVPGARPCAPRACC